MRWNEMEWSEVEMMNRGSGNAGSGGDQGSVGFGNERYFGRHCSLFFMIII